MPERGMREYTVRKTNVICYHGNTYGLPLGTYKNQSSKVWVDVKGQDLFIYDNDTGKQIAHHRISEERGKNRQSDSIPNAFPKMHCRRQ